MTHKAVYSRARPNKGQNETQTPHTSCSWFVSSQTRLPKKIFLLYTLMALTNQQWTTSQAKRSLHTKRQEPGQAMTDTTQTIQKCQVLSGLIHTGRERNSNANPLMLLASWVDTHSHSHQRVPFACIARARPVWIWPKMFLPKPKLPLYTRKNHCRNLK